MSELSLQLISLGHVTIRLLVTMMVMTCIGIYLCQYSHKSHEGNLAEELTHIKNKEEGDR